MIIYYTDILAKLIKKQNKGSLTEKEDRALYTLLEWKYKEKESKNN